MRGTADAELMGDRCCGAPVALEAARASAALSARSIGSTRPLDDSAATMDVLAATAERNVGLTGEGGSTGVAEASPPRMGIGRMIADPDSTGTGVILRRPL